jgi:ribosomal subunit interface protein
MLFDIKATNIKLTEGILAHVEKKLAPLGAKLKRFGEGVKINVEVGLDTHHHKKGEVFRAEISISLPPKKLIYASANDSDLYAAVVTVKKDVERQLIDFKETLVAKQRTGARAAKRRATRE